MSKHPEATDKDTNELFKKIQLTEISVGTIDKLLTDNKFKQTVMELRERDARGDLDPEVEGNVRRRKRARGLNKFIVACSFDSKVIEYLDLDHVEQVKTRARINYQSPFQ